MASVSSVISVANYPYIDLGEDENMAGPLTGVRVIDMTTVVMGPYATQILGDMCAYVIKVEPPGGDVCRHLTPFRNRGMSAVFLNLNRNKRSVALDLKRDDERKVLLDLVTGADVFVKTVRPQARLRRGLGCVRLRELNPGLDYCRAY